MRTGEWLTNTPFTQFWQVKSIYLRCYRLIRVDTLVQNYHALRISCSCTVTVIGTFINLPQETGEKVEIAEAFSISWQHIFCAGELKARKMQEQTVHNCSRPTLSGGIPPLPWPDGPSSGRCGSTCSRPLVGKGSSGADVLSLGKPTIPGRRL